MRAMRGNSTSSIARIGATLDASVTERLRAAARRLRRYVLIEGLAWVLGFLVTAVLLQFALDYGTRGLRWSIRAALLALITAGVSALVWRYVMAPLRVRFGLAEMANLMERRYPQLSSILISAVRFSQGETGPAEMNSPSLAASVVARAGREASSIDFDAVLNPRRARRSAIVLAGLFGVCLLASFAAPENRCSCEQAEPIDGACSGICGH